MPKEKPLIIGLTRVRNEELIIGDTLNHLSEFCTGGIYVYDDCSEDNTAIICEAHPKVKKVIKGSIWDSNREKAEFENRQSLLSHAQIKAKDNDWFVYLDADERIEFDWNLIEKFDPGIIAVRMKLFDYYITPDDIDRNYSEREWIGPEYREIIFAFKNSDSLRYEFPDQREVTLGEGVVINSGYVKHYGKAISIEQWQNTCEYYSTHFPKYSEKWENRKGKAIHTQSDFGHKLINWSEKDLYGIPMNLVDAPSKNQKLKILLTNHHLLDYAGSELLSLTLADYLKRQEHDVTVYSKFIGEIKSWFDIKNIKTVDNLDLISNEKFDIAHVHHNISAIEVRHRFPDIPIIFYSQGILPFLEQPPQINLGIERYLAISEEVRDNIKSYGIESDKIEIIRNVIDADKFSSFKQTNEIPQNVLVISGRMDSQKEQIIRDCCKELGLSLQFVGGKFGVLDQTQLMVKIEWADIIFSLGRGAIEAMIAGRGVIVFDYLGGDGMITLETYNESKKNNFSGRRYGFMYDKYELINEIKKYDLSNIQKIQLMAIEEFSATNSVKQLEDIYREVIKNNYENKLTPEEISLLESINSIIKETHNYAFEIGLRKGSLNLHNNQHRIEIDLAEEFINSHRLSTAKEILTSILEKDIFNQDALNDLAVINIMENNFENATKIIKHILSLDPTNEIALGNLQYIQQNLQSLEEEKVQTNQIQSASFNAAIQKGDDENAIVQRWSTLIDQAESHIEKNELNQARNKLREVLSINPQSIDALNNLAVVDILENDFANARDLIDVILKIEPQNEVALNNKNFLIEQLKDQIVPKILLTKINSFKEFSEYIYDMEEEYLERRSYEEGLLLNESEFYLPGYCAVCESDVNFLVDYLYSHVDGGVRIPNWRERLVCPICNLNNRNRASLHLTKKIVPSLDYAKIFIAEQTTPLYQYLKSKYPNTIGSEYLGSSVGLGSINVAGIRNEDFTKLTFKDDELDTILSFDVFEHIPEYKKAFAESVRVLKPGGKLIFTVPFNTKLEENLIRAIVKDGKIEHILKPEYHGDPLNEKDGCLCYYHFGWEVLEELKSAGFSESYVYLIYSKEYGYLGGDQLVLVAEK